MNSDARIFLARVYICFSLRAEVPIDVLRDTIQPFPTSSEAFVSALSDLG